MLLRVFACIVVLLLKATLVIFLNQLETRQQFEAKEKKRPQKRPLFLPYLIYSMRITSVSVKVLEDAVPGWHPMDVT